MKEIRNVKRFTSIFLMLCMVLSGFGMTDMTVGHAAGNSTTVYFYNAGNWNEIGVYVYNATGEEFGANGEALGGWGSATAQTAAALGEQWYEIEVPALTGFNIIFYNKEKDSERAELWISDAQSIYVTVDAIAHTSKEEAETAGKEAQSNKTEEDTTQQEGETIVYFLNKKTGSRLDVTSMEMRAKYLDPGPELHRILQRSWARTG